MRDRLEIGALVRVELLDQANHLGVSTHRAVCTNNDADPNTNTTLFDIDAALDQISIQSPPNNGSLVATGKLGVDSGVDIDSDLKNGSTVASTAYVALNGGGTSRFFQVDILTGKVTARGSFAAGTLVIGISVPPGQ